MVGVKGRVVFENSNDQFQSEDENSIDVIHSIRLEDILGNIEFLT